MQSIRLKSIVIGVSKDVTMIVSGTKMETFVFVPDRNLIQSSLHCFQVVDTNRT